MVDHNYFKPNMTELAEQVYKRKEKYFYCEPVDPDNLNGPQNCLNLNMNMV